MTTNKDECDEIKEPMRFSRFEKAVAFGIAITIFQVIFGDKLNAIYTILGMILVVLTGIFEMMRLR